jgi:hypothetical protein
LTRRPTLLKIQASEVFEVERKNGGSCLFEVREKIMKIWLIVIVALSLFLSEAIPAQTQSTSELMALGDSVVSSIQSMKRDWKYEAVQPISGSVAVILQQWTLDSQSVRIAIVAHKSTQDAATAISKLAREGQLIERVQGFGEEGITWGRGVVSFRKRNLTIDVSAANTDSTLDPTELAKNLVEERKVAKEFALLVADVIKGK